MQDKSLEKSCLSLLLIFLLLGWSIPVQGQLSNNTSEKINITEPAKQDDSIEPEKFAFAYRGDNYLLLYNGKGIRTTSEGKTDTFSLPLDKGWHIRNLYYLGMGGDLLIVYEISDYESGGGKVIYLDQKTLKQRWLADIPGFNIGQAVIKDQGVYLTAIGFVGKLNLSSGKYLWKHSGLYNYQKGSGEFNSFEKPTFDGRFVKFTEVLFPSKKAPPMTIVVDDNTGEIVKTRSFGGGR